METESQGEWTVDGQKEGIRISRYGKKIRMMDSETELSGEEIRAGVFEGIVVQCGTAGGSFRLKSQVEEATRRGTALYRMTPMQEYLNAFSMLGPTLYCLYFCYTERVLDFSQKEDLRILVMVVGTSMHFPFSFGYHIWCALNPVGEHILTTWHRLDLTFIVVCGMLWSFALSGSAYYCLVFTVLDTYMIRLIWQPGSDKNHRRAGMSFGIIFYLLPIIWMYSPLQFAKCFFCFFVSALAFANTERLYGYGSLIFHLGMLPYQMLLLETVTGPS